MEMTIKMEYLEPDSILVKLSGHISEASDFEVLLENTASRVRSDLEEIERINSCGVREWVRFLRRLCHGRNVTLERCSVAFVRQTNIIFNMQAKTRITSIMLPYYCPKCRTEQTKLCDSSQHI